VGVILWKKEGKRKENNGIMVARFETENKGVEKCHVKYWVRNFSPLRKPEKY